MIIIKCMIVTSIAGTGNDLLMAMIEIHSIEDSANVNVLGIVKLCF